MDNVLRGDLQAKMALVDAANSFYLWPADAALR